MRESEEVKMGADVDEELTEIAIKTPKPDHSTQNTPFTPPIPLRQIPTLVDDVDL